MSKPDNYNTSINNKFFSRLTPSNMSIIVSSNLSKFILTNMSKRKKQFHFFFRLFVWLVVWWLIFHIQDAHRVGESGSLLPSGDNDDGIPGLDETTGLSEVDAELYAIINVLHPIRGTVLCSFIKISNHHPSHLLKPHQLLKRIGKWTRYDWPV